MKKLFLLFAIAILAFACDKDDPKPKQKKWDADKMVLIKPDKTAFNLTKAGEENPKHLTALEIVQQGDYLAFMKIWDTTPFGDKKLEKPLKARRGFSEAQKDFNIPALKMWGDDIIDDATGQLVKNFLYGCDAVVCNRQTHDTIAYIPNKVLKDARPLIERAYKEKRYEDVYRLFDEAFTFKPITGAEWRELKKQGLQ